ncbi:MAG: hypothetical protein Q8S57_00455 [Methanoregula sp.]|nr:hypothetical protein [Methanoregula sp.]
MRTRNEGVSPTRIWAEYEGAGKGTGSWSILPDVPVVRDTGGRLLY